MNAVLPDPDLLEEIVRWLTWPGADGEALLVTPLWSHEDAAPCDLGTSWLTFLQERSGGVRGFRVLTHGGRRLRVVAVSQGALPLRGLRLERAWCWEGIPNWLELEVLVGLESDTTRLRLVRLGAEASQ